MNSWGGNILDEQLVGGIFRINSWGRGGMQNFTCRCNIFKKMKQVSCNYISICFRETLTIGLVQSHVPF